MEYNTVLVTGIGGNVGQGIIRNLNNLGLNIKSIGTNTELISPGNHLCDYVYQVPYAYEDDYIQTISEICLIHKVNLIIPSTDFEIYYLGKAKSLLPTIACTEPEVSILFLDKLKNFQEFNKRNIPFAKTCLPSSYEGEFNAVIVKPRHGRGSREIHCNPIEPRAYSDDKYVIQELHAGKEITTALYVLKSGELNGFITFKRSLHHGTTNICEVVFDYDNQLKEIILKILKHFRISGSANIQSIVKKSGEIIPFEINCRISGTNSIRANLGFEDVKYTIQEYLLQTKPDKPNIIKGSAIRILMDVIYPNIGLNEIKNKDTHHFIF